MDKIGLEAIFDLGGWSGNFKTYISDIDKANSKTMSFTDSISKIGQITIAAIGASIAAIGAAISGFTYVSIQDAISVESAFAGVIKTTDGLADAFGNLTDMGLRMKTAFRDLSKEIPVTTEELMKIGEIGGQLGVPEDRLIEFTKVIAAMGVSTDLSTEQAAFGFATLTNVMGLSKDQFDEIGSAIVRLGNTSNTTESRILGFAERIAGAGKISGMGVADILGIAAAFSSVGAEAQAGGTATQKVILKMSEAVAAGGAELGIFAQTAGVTASDFAKMWKERPVAAFAAFVTGLGEQGDKAFGTLSDIGIANQLLVRDFLKIANAEGLLVDRIDESNKAYEENTALMWEAGQRYATTESQLKMLKNTVRDLGVEFGTSLLPAVGTVIDVARELIEKHGPSIEEFFRTVGGLVSKFAKAFAETGDPIFSVKYALYQMLPPGMAAQISDIVDQVVEFKDRVMEFITPIAEWIAKNVELKDVLVALGIAVAVAIAPVVATVLQLVGTFMLIVAAVAAVRQAWENDFLGIRTALTEFWESSAKPALENLWEWLQINIPIAIQTLSDFWTNTLWPAIQSVSSYINEVVIPTMQDVWNWLSVNIPAAIETAKQTWESLKETIAGAWENIKTFVEDGINSIVNFWTVGDHSIWEDVSTIWGGIFDFVSWLMESILTIVAGILDMTFGKWVQFGGAVTEYTSMWGDTLKTYFSSIWEGIKSMFSVALETIWAIVTNNFEAIKNIVMVVFETIASIIQNSVDRWRLIISMIASLIRGDFDKFGYALEEFWQSLGEDIKTIISADLAILKEVFTTAWENIKKIFNSSIENIKTAFTSMDWAQLGKDVIAGIADGIKNGASRVAEAAKDAAQSALQAAKDFLLIKSPSKVFKMQIGKNISLGMAEGISAYKKQPLAVIRGLSTEMASVPSQPNISTTNNYNNNRNVNIEINPSYANYQSPASLYFDVISAIGRV